jgi:hypothetical protein
MNEKEPAEEKDGFGLDKNARLAAERAEAEEEARREPLDPPFPYRVVAINSVLVVASAD